jgi:histidinol phosphatase-like enzyme
MRISQTHLLVGQAISEFVEWGAQQACGNEVRIMSETKKRYVLLDRDGVINRRMPGGYVTRWNQFEFLPRVLEGLRLLADHGYTAIILSNQACVPATTYFVGDCLEDWRAADDAGCPMILIRRTSFLEVRCVHEESPIVACNLYEAAELILAAQHSPPRASAMAMQQGLS